MAGIVETGAVIGNSKFLDLFNRSGVINGDGGVIAQCVQEEHLLLAKTFHGAVDELNYAQHPML